MAHNDVTLYLNGRVWSGISDHAQDVYRQEAMAVRGDRVLAVGTNWELRQQWGRDAAIVDLQGRCLVPGLIDGHDHAVRAGLTWYRELDWTGIRTGGEALASIAAAAQTLAPGDWISVVGGWHETQFLDGWSPTMAELDALAPGIPIYLQCLYEHAVVSSAGLAAAAVEAANLPAGAIEVDASGRPTGRLLGMLAFGHVIASMGRPSLEQQIAGTRSLFATLAGRGVTGVNDPGGFGMGPEQYDALYELWRRDGLDLRLRLFLSATDVGGELAQVSNWIRHAQPGFGDDRLRITGIGEVVHFGCHDFEGLTGFVIDDRALDELEEISSLVAARRWPMQVHAVTDESVGRVLDCWERVHERTPIDGLRFSLAHGDRVGPANIARMARLGIGLIVDDRQVFRSSASSAVWGAGAMASVPPLGDLVSQGIHLGAGTDGSRASSYDPWLCIWWLLEGRSLDGSSHRDARHLLSRPQALDIYTRGNAWFTFEEHLRGQLAAGQLADFAVLNEDYFRVEAEAIPGLYSELTVVGGRAIHSSGVLAEPTATPA
jgi:predicted amidohydrolase YtcJ